MIRNILRLNRLAAACGLAIGFTAAATAAPVLEVRVDNVVQANNATVTLNAAQPGQVSPKVIVLRNIGDQDLNFTSIPAVVLFGGDDFLFSVIQPPLETGNKLSPNSSTAFRVDFAPGATGAAPGRKSTRAFVFTNANPTVFALTIEADLLPNPNAAPPPDEEEIDEAPADQEIDDAAPDADANAGDDDNANDDEVDQEVIEGDEDELIEDDDGQDAYDDDDDNEEIVKFAAPCGFGIGLGLVGSLASLGGMRRTRR